jgi:hypothetical protein
VLKAAQIATVEPGPDSEKRIHQRHFIQGMAEVMAAENVMSQSLFEDGGAAGQLGGVMDRLAEGQEELRGELALLAERFESLEHKFSTLNDDRLAERAELERSQSRLLESFTSGRQAKDRLLISSVVAAVILAVAALLVDLRF